MLPFLTRSAGPEGPTHERVAYQRRPFPATAGSCDRQDAGTVVGTYYLRANNRGGGAHVANCGYVVAPEAFGRGVAQAMCSHSLGEARSRGFNSMQFNFVIASNERAVRLWQRMGFAIAGRLPEAFQHPRLGLVDAYVMLRNL